MHPLLNIAIGAARRAGDVIVRSLDRVGALTVSEKGRNDFVSEVDRAAEQAVIAAIHKAYPTHGILAEESGAQRRRRLHLGHRPARRYHEFPARFSAVRGFGGLPPSRPRGSRASCWTRTRGELFTAERGAGTHPGRPAAARFPATRDSTARRSAPVSRSARTSNGSSHTSRCWRRVMDATAGVRRPGAAVARSRVRRRRAPRRVLGSRPLALGHGRRQPAHHRSRRPGRRLHRRRVPRRRQPAGRNAARFRRARGDIRAAARRRASQMTAGRLLAIMAGLG